MKGILERLHVGPLSLARRPRRWAAAQCSVFAQAAWFGAGERPQLAVRAIETLQTLADGLRVQVRNRK